MSLCPSWNRLPLSERLSVLGLLIVALGLVSFFSFFVTAASLLAMIRQVGLAALLTVMGVTLWGCYVLFADWCRRSKVSLNWSFGRRYVVPVGVWAACSLVVISAFPMANRIVMDEIVVLATSKAIHEEREPVVPTSMMLHNGVMKLDQAYVDKRPFLFATLVSLSHDLLGYSPRNPFYCNMVLGCLSLALVGVLGTRMGRGRRAGVLSMIALAAVPLFCEHATGGGIDILNLAMILVVAFLTAYHIERPTLASARALIGAGILLAYSRYESLLFAALPILALLVVYRREKRLLIEWSTPLMALCLLPLLGIHFLTFSQSSAFFQLAEKGLENAFSLKYIVPNLGHALLFFLDTAHFFPNSPAVFVGGVISLVVVGVVNVKRWREVVADGGELTFWILAGVVLAAFFLLMAYSWGELDQLVASRLSLPLYLLFALSLGYCCREFHGLPRVLVVLAVGLAVSGYWSIFPIAAKQYGRKLYASGQVLECLDAFSRMQPDRHFMVLNGIQNFWLTRDVFALQPSSLESNPAFLRNLLDSGLYRRVYLVQVFERRSDEGVFVLNKNDGADLPLDTTPISDDLVTEVRRVRISLVNPASIALLDRFIAEKSAKAGIPAVPASMQPPTPSATR